MLGKPPSRQGAERHQADFSFPLQGGNSLPDSNLETWGFLCTSCCNDGVRLVPSILLPRSHPPNIAHSSLPVPLQASGEACGGTNAIDIYISTSTVPVPVTVSSGPVKAVSTVFDCAFFTFFSGFSAADLPPLKITAAIRTPSPLVPFLTLSPALPRTRSGLPTQYVSFLPADSA